MKRLLVRLFRLFRFAPPDGPDAKILARMIAHAFHDMHAAMGECRCNGPWPTTNHALEYAVAYSTNARARSIHRCINEVRRGILLRRQERIRIILELQARKVA